jgi:hypothetical protein
MAQKSPDPVDRSRALQARTVGIVLAVTILAWMGVQWLGGQFGWETRFVFLADLAAIAAFLWALVVTYQIWRSRQS